MSYVIVDLGNNNLKSTRVRKDSVGKPFQPPTCYAEAVIQQNPDIEGKMNKLCAELAKCNIVKDGAGIFEILERKLAEATARQSGMGSLATWRHVQYNRK